MERLFEELAGEAVKELLRAVRGTFFCRSTAERLRRNVEPLLPLVQPQAAQGALCKAYIEFLIMFLVILNSIRGWWLFSPRIWQNSAS